MNKIKIAGALAVLTTLISVPMLGQDDQNNDEYVYYSKCKDGVLSVTLNHDNHMPKSSLVEATKLFFKFPQMRQRLVPSNGRSIRFELYTSCKDEECAKTAGWYDIQAHFDAYDGVSITCKGDEAPENNNGTNYGNNNECSEDNEGCQDSGRDEGCSDDGNGCQDEPGDEEGPGGVIIGT